MPQGRQGRFRSGLAPCWQTGDDRGKDVKGSFGSMIQDDTRSFFDKVLFVSLVHCDVGGDERVSDDLRYPENPLISYIGSNLSLPPHSNHFSP